MDLQNIDEAKKILSEREYRLKENGPDHYLVLLDRIRDRVKRKIGILPPTIATIYGNQIYGVERDKKLNKKHQRNIADLLDVEFI